MRKVVVSVMTALAFWLGAQALAEDGKTVKTQPDQSNQQATQDKCGTTPTDLSTMTAEERDKWAKDRNGSIVVQKVDVGPCPAENKCGGSNCHQTSSCNTVDLGITICGPNGGFYFTCSGGQTIHKKTCQCEGETPPPCHIVSVELICQ